MTNFERARAAHAALKDFFAKHPKGRLEANAIEHLHALCEQASNAVNDAECRFAIRKIAGYSSLLSSPEPQRGGADFVRLRVQNALASFRSNLRAIEAGER